MTGNEWDTADTCPVSGTPASCVANTLLQSSEKESKVPGGIDLPGWVQVQDAPQRIWEKKVVLICSVGMLNLH